MAGKITSAYDEFFIHNCSSLHDLTLQSSTQLSTNNHDLDNLVTACISQIKFNYWYNILPFDKNDASDISHAIRQRCSYLCPLLVKIGYKSNKKIPYKLTQLNIKT